MVWVVGLVRWPLFGCFAVEWICLGVVCEGAVAFIYYSMLKG